MNGGPIETEVSLGCSEKIVTLQQLSEQGYISGNQVPKLYRTFMESLAIGPYRDELVKFAKINLNSDGRWIIDGFYADELDEMLQNETVKNIKGLRRGTLKAIKNYARDNVVITTG